MPATDRGGGTPILGLDVGDVMSRRTDVKYEGGMGVSQLLLSSLLPVSSSSLLKILLPGSA